MIDSNEIAPRDKERLINKCVRELIPVTPELHKGNHFDIYLNDYKTNMSTPAKGTIAIELAIDSTNDTTELDPALIGRIKNAIHIYTDGSKKSEGYSVGSACFSPELNVSRSLSINPQASVYTAECLAINEAIKIALEDPQKDYKIVTDSFSALTSLSRPSQSVRENRFIVEAKQNYELFIQRNNNQYFLKFEWIPSHTGIEGNEEADRLAGEATENLPNAQLLIPFSDYPEDIKKRSFDATLEVCLEEGRDDSDHGKGKEFFKEFYRKSRKPWFYNKNLSRRSIVWVNRARSNHYHLSASLKRKNIIDSAQCECGHPSEDLDHVLWDCPRHDQPRQIMYNSFRLNQFPPPLNCRVILKDLDSKIIDIITKFLKDSNLNV
ncbi:uncharacterized protein LOC107037476 [Diachasma alloeum]|uniref:uncharacterized protein LOC107037476 n=1 Tax=Diachasma alloeum TaxID=454923 RepID=UPI0007383DF4|nr:uncharacterized protein LOC107037476 [Diachasma alloeum]